MGHIPLVWFRILRFLANKGLTWSCMFHLNLSLFVFDTRNITYQFWREKTQRSRGRWWKESPLSQTPHGRHDRMVSPHGGHAQGCSDQDQDGSVKTTQISPGSLWLSFRRTQDRLFPGVGGLFKVLVWSCHSLVMYDDLVSMVSDGAYRPLLEIICCKVSEHRKQGATH